MSTHAGHLRRHGDVADHGPEAGSDTRRSSFASPSRSSCVRHGALVFLREERALPDATPRQLRAHAGVAHDSWQSRRWHASVALRRVGQHAARGTPVTPWRREERRDPAQARLVGGVHVHARRAVRVHVDEAGHKAVRPSDLHDARFLMRSRFSPIFAISASPQSTSAAHETARSDRRARFDQELPSMETSSPH